MLFSHPFVVHNAMKRQADGSLAIFGGFFERAKWLSGAVLFHIVSHDLGNEKPFLVIKSQVLCSLRIVRKWVE